MLHALDSAPIQWNHETRVLVKDTSGILGGVYTLLAPNHLNHAWHAPGRPGTFIFYNMAPKQPNAAPLKRAVPFCDDCQTTGFTDIVEVRRKKGHHLLGDDWSVWVRDRPEAAASP